MRTLILRWAERVMRTRSRDQVIRTDGIIYLERWYIWKTWWSCLYLHRFRAGDRGRSPHDHPWWSLSYVLRGWYIERIYQTDPRLRAQPVFNLGPEDAVGFNHDGQAVFHVRTRVPKPGALIFRKATHLHRIARRHGPETCVTLFLTGPRQRPWGFATSKGWVEHGSAQYEDIRARGEL